MVAELVAVYDILVPITMTRLQHRNKKTEFPEPVTFLTVALQG